MLCPLGWETTEARLCPWTREGAPGGRRAAGIRGIREALWKRRQSSQGLKGQQVSEMQEVIGRWEITAVILAFPWNQAF